MALMRKNIEAPEWFFAWLTGRPYITSICGWNRSTVIGDAIRANGLTWKQIYRRGGRAIRCRVAPLPHAKEDAKV